MKNGEGRTKRKKRNDITINSYRNLHRNFWPRLEAHKPNPPVLQQRNAPNLIKYSENTWACPSLSKLALSEDPRDRLQKRDDPIEVGTCGLTAFLKDVGGQVVADKNGNRNEIVRELADQLLNCHRLKETESDLCCRGVRKFLRQNWTIYSMSFHTILCMIWMNKYACWMD